MKYLMNIRTGSVDTEQNWKDDAESDGWDFSKEIDKNLVEVEKDEDGNWIEVS